MKKQQARKFGSTAHIDLNFHDESFGLPLTSSGTAM